MKQRSGLDAIGYLGDIMFANQTTPVPTMKDGRWSVKPVSQETEPEPLISSEPVVAES